MFRAANQRGNQILDAAITLTVARNQTTKEGLRMRRFEELKPVRERTSLFALSWTVMHRIDETSPLYGITPDMCDDSQLEIIALLSGMDETSRGPHLCAPLLRAGRTALGPSFR